MQGLPLKRANLVQAAVLSMLSLAALAALGSVLAYWTWVWFAPRAEPRAAAVTLQSGSVASASLVFGTLPRNQVAPTGIAIRLLGVVAAAGGRRGYAVVQLDAKQILAVQEGHDIAPGVQLAEVLADHVVLNRGGVSETLAWPEKRAAASAGAARANR